MPTASGTSVGSTMCSVKVVPVGRLNHSVVGNEEDWQDVMDVAGEFGNNQNTSSDERDSERASKVTVAEGGVNESPHIDDVLFRSP